MAVHLQLIIKSENVVEKVKEITNNIGVPVVYDGVGKDTFNISLECLVVTRLNGFFWPVIWNGSSS